MSEKIVTIDGRDIEITHSDKLLFPDAGISKLELANYWAQVAPVALVHYRGRPLSMERYPDGIDRGGFFQKAIPDYFPDWIDRIELSKQEGRITHVVADNAATLVYLANQGMITPHLGLSRGGRISRPDRLVIDLDPSDADFEKVQTAAAHVREALERLGARPCVQTTGSRGLHVVLALDRSAEFDAARSFAHSLAKGLAERHPELLTVEQRKAKRGDRVFLDFLRNAYGQTSVAPYAVRARPSAPIATPLDWDEALGADMTPQRYTIKTIFRRLGQKKDPWAGIDDAPARIAELEARLRARPH